MTLFILYMELIIQNIYFLSFIYSTTVMVEQRKINKYFEKESQYKIQSSQLFPRITKKITLNLRA